VTEEYRAAASKQNCPGDRYERPRGAAQEASAPMQAEPNGGDRRTTVPVLIDSPECVREMATRHVHLVGRQLQQAASAYHPDPQMPAVEFCASDAQMVERLAAELNEALSILGQVGFSKRERALRERRGEV